MNPQKKIRLDLLLLEKGHYRTRARAQAAIIAGVVKIDGRTDLKAGDRVDPGCVIEISEPECPYVSRGGLKLVGALDHFKINPPGFFALDIGASTGGFTDCLLKRGAERVVALDVGRGLLDWKIRTDKRVEVIEKVNARTIGDDVASGPYDIIVIDVSFISLKLIFPNLPKRLKKGGIILALIKPQFESGIGSAPGGVVRDPETWRAVLEEFSSPGIFQAENPPSLQGFSVSSVTGKEGNREFFGLWRDDVARIESGLLAESIDACLASSE